MCIPPVPVGAILEVGVMSLIRKTLEPCNWKLIICRGSCAANGKGELPLTLIFLLVMRGMVATNLGQELPPVNLSCVMRIITVSIGIRARLAKA